MKGILALLALLLLCLQAAAVQDLEIVEQKVGANSYVKQGTVAFYFYIRNNTAPLDQIWVNATKSGVHTIVNKTGAKEGWNNLTWTAASNQYGTYTLSVYLNNTQGNSTNFMAFDTVTIAQGYYTRVFDVQLEGRERIYGQYLQVTANCSGFNGVNATALTIEDLTMANTTPARVQWTANVSVTTAFSDKGAKCGMNLTVSCTTADGQTNTTESNYLMLLPCVMKNTTSAFVAQVDGPTEMEFAISDDTLMVGPVRTYVNTTIVANAGRTNCTVNVSFPAGGSMVLMMPVLQYNTTYNFCQYSASYNSATKVLKVGNYTVTAPAGGIAAGVGAGMLVVVGLAVGYGVAWVQNRRRG